MFQCSQHTRDKTTNKEWKKFFKINLWKEWICPPCKPPALFTDYSSEDEFEATNKEFYLFSTRQKVFFIILPSYPPSCSTLSFAIWRAAALVEWLSSGHWIATKYFYFWAINILIPSGGSNLGLECLLEFDTCYLADTWLPRPVPKRFFIGVIKSNTWRELNASNNSMYHCFFKDTLASFNLTINSFKIK